MESESSSEQAEEAKPAASERPLPRLDPAVAMMLGLGLYRHYVAPKSEPEPLPPDEERHGRWWQLEGHELFAEWQRRPAARPAGKPAPAKKAGRAKPKSYPSPPSGDGEEIVSPRGLKVSYGVHGRGVFATKPFRAGAVVERSPVLEVLTEDYRIPLADYLFRSGSADRSLLALGFGVLYNHSFTPNLRYERSGDSALEFVAVRNIQPGEELTLNYGREWWERRSRVPRQETGG